MFADQKLFDRAVRVARSDLRGYFDSSFIRAFPYRKKNGTSKEIDYGQFLDHLRSIDPIYFNHRFNEVASLDFVERLISWLEYTREEQRQPWRRKGLRQVEIPPETMIRAFLRHLLHWINELVTPGETQQMGYGNPLHPGKRLWSFRNFVAKRRLVNGEWKIFSQPATDGDRRLLRGFISWLVLLRDEPVLHIVYDKERITKIFDLSSEKEKFICRSQSRRIFLHEIGHARLNLPWFLDQASGVSKTTWSTSLPAHEYEAWLYAITVRSVLLSMRSRLTRMLDDKDAEWRVYL